MPTVYTNRHHAEQNKHDGERVVKYYGKFIIVPRRRRK